MLSGVIYGDCRVVLPTLSTASVDLVFTSPPYFAQREYGDNAAAEIGRESTPTAYLAALCDVTRECFRVLRPDGHMIVNLGDKYNADGPVKRASVPAGYPRARRQPRFPGMSLKSLMLLPQRYAIECADVLGLAVRAEIVWVKGAGGGDGKARDRVRRAHETLWHLTRRLRHGEALPVYADPGASVWAISQARAQKAHTADFPAALAERVIACYSPPGGVVLDPFAGSGTVLDVAFALGREAIGIELYA